MPQFYAGEAKTARVTMRNPTSKDFSYQAAVILGLPEIARSEQSFAIPAGEERIIDFPLTIPSVTGTHPVYVHVSAASKTLAIYQATEDVTILPALEVGYSSRINSCLKADVYDVMEDKILTGTPSMLYPDILDEKMVYRLRGDKALIFPAWGSWPVIYWQYRGPYQLTITPGAYRFDAATGKYDGVQLTEISAVANRARLRGRIVSVASGQQVTADRFSYIIGDAGVMDIDSYEDVPGYQSIGAFLAPRMAFAGLTPGWPYWNIPYGYPTIPGPASEPLLIIADVSWKYNVVTKDQERYIYLSLSGDGIQLQKLYPPEAYEFSGTLSRGPIDPTITYPEYLRTPNQTIYYNISGNVSPFAVFIELGLPSPNLYGLAGGMGYQLLGPGSGSIKAFSTGSVRMYAHPDPNAHTKDRWRWRENYWRNLHWQLIASVT
jgi:hypothetical protein